jgi:hypothetical protein
MQIYNDLILSALVCCSHNLFFCFNNSSSSSSVKKSVFESKPIRLYSVIEGMLSLETEKPVEQSHLNMWQKYKLKECNKRLIPFQITEIT